MFGEVYCHLLVTLYATLAIWEQTWKSLCEKIGSVTVCFIGGLISLLTL